MNDDPAVFPVEERRRLAAGTRAAAVAVGNILQEWIDLRSVLDLACGTGAWLGVLSSGGRCEVFGVEGEAYHRRDLEIDPDLVLTADLGQTIDLHRRFDLVLCLEVAEHIDAARAAPSSRTVYGMATWCCSRRRCPDSRAFITSTNSHRSTGPRASRTTATACWM